MNPVTIHIPKCIQSVQQGYLVLREADFIKYHIPTPDSLQSTSSGLRLSFDSPYKVVAYQYQLQSMLDSTTNVNCRIRLQKLIDTIAQETI